MKVKALQNIGGIVNAKSGEEFEVKNEALLKDLLQQGLVMPSGSDAQAVANLYQADSKVLNHAIEMATFERLEMEKAYSEEVQKKVNQEEAKLQEERNRIKEQAMQQAKQNFQQMQQQQVQQEQMSHGQVQHASEQSVAKAEVKHTEAAAKMTQQQQQAKGQSK